MTLRPGQKVAHRDVDNPEGGARVGSVSQVIGEGDGSLVIASWEDDKTEGYDNREIKPLVAHSDDSPVILHFRHLRVLWSRPKLLLAAMITVISPLSLLILFHYHLISGQIAAAIAAVSLALVLLLASSRN